MVELCFVEILPSIRNWVLVLDGGVLYCAIGNQLTTQDSILVISRFVTFLASSHTSLRIGNK